MTKITSFQLRNHKNTNRYPLPELAATLAAKITTYLFFIGSSNIVKLSVGKVVDAVINCLAT